MKIQKEELAYQRELLLLYDSYYEASEVIMHKVKRLITNPDMNVKLIDIVKNISFLQLRTSFKYDEDIGLTNRLIEKYKQECIDIAYEQIQRNIIKDITLLIHNLKWFEGKVMMSIPQLYLQKNRESIGHLLKEICKKYDIDILNKSQSSKLKIQKE